jgi:YVTN family beta-propeller protein
MDQLKAVPCFVGMTLLAWCGSLQADAVVATVPTGNGPTALCIDSVTNRIYVANGLDNTVTVINGATNVASTVNVGQMPVAIAVNPATSTVYATDGNDNFISVIKEGTNAVSSVNIGSPSWAIAVNPATNTIYAMDNNGIAVINGTSNAVSTIKAGTSETYAGVSSIEVAVNTTSDKIYAVNSDGTTLTVINGVTNAASTVTIGTNPFGVVINPATDIVYASGNGNTYITAINGTTNAASSIATEPFPYYYIGSLAVNPVTTMLYAGSWNSVVAINGTTNAASIIPTGAIPYALAVNPVNNMIYTANSDSNSVTVLSGATNAVSTLKVGDNPLTLAVNIVTGLLYVVNQNGNSVTVIAGSPPIPVLVAPANAAANEPLQVSLSWNSAAWAKSYTLQVSNTPTFIGGNLNQSGTSATSFTVGGLATGTTCYWRVEASGTGGTGAWSAAWSFTTAPLPAAPVLSSPSNGAVTSLSGVTLAWNSAAAATSYGLQLATSSGFTTTLLAQTGLPLAPKSASGFTNSMVYYWRVNATGPGGTGAWSGAWSFTALTPPGIPALASPLSGTVVHGTALTLSWSSVACTAYRVQYSISSSFTMVADTVLSGTTRLVSSPIANTPYYWRVYAINAAGNSAWSSVWSFTVSTTGARQETVLAAGSAFAVKNGIAAYALAQECPVDLRIFDILGQKLFEFRRIQTPGSYSLSIKSLNLPARVYIVDFKAGALQRQVTAQGR